MLEIRIIEDGVMQSRQGGICSFCLFGSKPAAMHKRAGDAQSVIEAAMAGIRLRPDQEQ